MMQSGELTAVANAELNMESAAVYSHNFGHLHIGTEEYNNSGLFPFDNYYSYAPFQAVGIDNSMRLFVGQCSLLFVGQCRS